MSDDRVTRFHVGGSFAIGLLGVVCATGSLSPGQKNSGNLIASFFSAAIGGGWICGSHLPLPNCGESRTH